MIDSATLPLQIGVKAFIQNNDNKYLMLLRAKPYRQDTQCKWDIPGGRINVKETLMDALAREIQEETGLKLTGVPKLLLAQDIIVPDKHVVRLTYLATAEGKITLDPKEHKSYGWYTKAELPELYHDIFLTPVLSLLQ